MLLFFFFFFLFVEKRDDAFPYVTRDFSVINTVKEVYGVQRHEKPCEERGGGISLDFDVGGGRYRQRFVKTVYGASAPEIYRDFLCFAGDKVKEVVRKLCAVNIVSDEHAARKHVR